MAWNAFGGFGGHAIAVRGGDEIRHERRWFADEVVIDFPSVAPAVERMRSAFLADEHAKTLTAALEISPREAREGATVPLDVPVRCTCRACGGRGETWTQPCGCCAGSGIELLHHQVHITRSGRRRRRRLLPFLRRATPRPLHAHRAARARQPASPRLRIGGTARQASSPFSVRLWGALAMLVGISLLLLSAGALADPASVLTALPLASPPA